MNVEENLVGLKGELCLACGGESDIDKDIYREKNNIWWYWIEVGAWIESC
jgi:hypothetical protein